MEYIKALINGKHPALIGNPTLEGKDLFGLKAGSQIKSIGCYSKTNPGKETSSCRKDNFEPPLEYAGIYKTSQEEYAAFLVPQKYIVEKETAQTQKPIYVLYVVLWGMNELILQNFENNTIRMYRAIFNYPH